MVLDGVESRSTEVATVFGPFLDAQKLAQAQNCDARTTPPFIRKFLTCWVTSIALSISGHHSATMLDSLVHHYCRSSRAKCKNWLRNWTAVFALRCSDESCRTNVVIKINEGEIDFDFWCSPDRRSHICVCQIPPLGPKTCHLALPASRSAPLALLYV